MKLLFLKDRLKYKKGNTYEVNDNQLIKAFTEFKVAKICFIQNDSKDNYAKEKIEKINLELLSYKELRNLCKKHKLVAVGKREDLIDSLGRCLKCI